MRVAPAHARLPAARPFGLEAGIAGEGAGEEAVEVVEGRLGDSFTISGVESKAFHRAHQNGGAEGGGVGEGAEGVMARGEVGDDPIGPLRAPLAGEGGQAAAAGLVGAAEIAGVAPAEALGLML